MLEGDVVRGVRIVAVPEEVDITNAPALRAALQQAAADGSPALVVDMTRTRFCDSAGLRVLVDAHKRALAAGGALLLAVPVEAVLRVLEISGIDQVIPHFASLDEAVTHAAGSTG
jgi:anti-sigma B factor antagonist